MKYALLIAGLLTMCVPEDASILRFIIQASIGLALFAYGTHLCIEEGVYD